MNIFTGLGVLEDGAGQERTLLAASSAFVDRASLVRPGPVVTAARAAEPVGPTRLEQILTGIGPLQSNQSSTRS